MTFDGFIDAVIELAQSIGAQGEMLDSLLAMLDDDGSPSIDLLDVGPGTNIIAAARSLVKEWQPRYAVLCCESWVAKVDPNSNDPDYMLLLARRIQVRDLPAHKRGDGLWVYAESRDGQRREHAFDIETPSSGPRRYTTRDLSQIEITSTRFSDLYGRRN